MDGFESYAMIDLWFVRAPRRISKSNTQIANTPGRHSLSIAFIRHLHVGLMYNRCRYECLCYLGSLPAAISEHAWVHGDSNRAWIWGRTLESRGQHRGVTWKMPIERYHCGAIYPIKYAYGFIMLCCGYVIILSGFVCFIQIRGVVPIPMMLPRRILVKPTGTIPLY